MLCNTHHITAHNNGQFIVRTLVINIQLNICKVYHMQPDRPGITGNDPGKIHNLLLCSLTCVRRRMEICCFNAHTSLGNHISGHRTVDTTGQKKHRLSVRSNRHSACSRNNLRIHIDLIADLYMQHDIRMMHIYTGLRKRFQNSFTKITVDLHRCLRIRLSCSSCFHLESQVLIRIHFIHVCHNILLQFIKSLILHTDNRTDADKTKHSCKVLYRIVIIVFSFTVHVDPCLRLIDLELTVYILKSISYLPYKGIFKQISVLPLNSYLTVF